MENLLLLLIGIWGLSVALALGWALICILDFFGIIDKDERY
jgi:hypothetical protein